MTGATISSLSDPSEGLSSEGADMSVVETNVVDIIAVPEWEPENVVLVIFDHL